MSLEGKCHDIQILHFVFGAVNSGAKYLTLHSYSLDHKVHLLGVSTQIYTQTLTHACTHTHTHSRCVAHKGNDQSVISLLFQSRPTVKRPHPLHSWQVDGGCLVDTHTTPDNPQRTTRSMTSAGDNLTRDGGMREGGRGREGDGGMEG